MTEASRKRSRKSKIVLRDCALDDEDDIELQVRSKSKKIREKEPEIRETKKPVPKKPAPKHTKINQVANKSVLNKIKAPTEKNDEEITPKFDINVEIEVETCDDENFNTNNDDQSTDQVKEIKKNKHSLKEIKKNKKEKKQDAQPIFLLREKILEESNKITETSSNLADGILDICLRNTMGFLTEPHDDTWYEKEIQKALNSWQTWQASSFHRENPLFYKCYICQKSWWNLSEFRDHIQVHTELKVDIEKYSQHECNIIAFEPNKKPDEIKDFFTDGPCYRCGKDYSKHGCTSKNLYMNIGCTKGFPTCTELKDHAFACKVCRIEKNCYYCEICTLSFEKIDDLTEHMLLMHSVRSDRPISANYSKCNSCAEFYSSNLYHSCKPKEPSSQCPYCFRSFSNKSLILEHINRSSKPCNCEVCSIEIKWSCKKYEHLLTHTNKYMLVKMCVACDWISIFLDDESAEQHKTKKHKFKGIKYDRFFPKILVPISCIYPNQDSEKNNSLLRVFPNQEALNQVSILRRLSINKQQESVLKPLESILKSQELSEQSVIESNNDSQTNISIPDLKQESISEGQEKTTENVMDNIKVKEEPIDSDDSQQLIIKEEPVDYDNEDDYTIQENDTENIETRIKQENEDSEYEEDIIKLNIDIEDLLAKQESSRVFYNTNDQSESNNDLLTPTIEIKNDRSVRVFFRTNDQSESNNDSLIPAINIKKERTSRDFFSTNDQSESNNDSLIPAIEIKKESILEPEVIISQKENKRMYRCSNCSFKGRHERYLRHVTIDCPYATIGNKKYICNQTGRGYVSIKKYMQHFLEHGHRPLRCPDCTKQFYTHGKLGSHVHSHVKSLFIRIKKISQGFETNLRPEYQCKKCMKLVLLEEFFQHWESHICDSKTVGSTPITPTLTTDVLESGIQDCINWMQKSPKECVYCKRKFQRVNECKRHLIEHLLTHAYAQKQVFGVLKCQICNAGFCTQEKYKEHMRNHASLPMYKCELCDKTFSDSSNFTKHKKVHNLKVIICDLCKKKFQSKATLAKHLEQHQASTPVNCEKCDKIFYFETAYKRHIKIFHEKVGLQRYPCMICNIRFRSLKLKWDHMWEIHKERKNKADCPICLKSFRKYTDVRAHAKREHYTEVSVFSVKNATKSVEDIQQILNINSDIKIGQAETLVVYDDVMAVS